MNILTVPVLADNYTYILETPDGHSAVIDPGDANPVVDALEKANIVPNLILLTHHHGDHVAGAPELKQRYGAQIAAPAAEVKKIPFPTDLPLKETSPLILGSTTKINILETPGHTKGHLCYHIPAANALFSGDTLFCMGCGRLFEGTAGQMRDSLEKLKTLPHNTKLYCGHEYTLQNAAFCKSIAPGNPAIEKRFKDIKRKRNSGIPTIPSTLQEEMDTNPFLQTRDTESFAALRTRKDRF